MKEGSFCKQKRHKTKKILKFFFNKNARSPFGSEARVVKPNKIREREGLSERRGMEKNKKKKRKNK